MAERFKLHKKSDLDFFIIDCQKALNMCLSEMRVTIPPSYFNKYDLEYRYKLFDFLNTNRTLWDDRYYLLLKKKTLNTFKYYRKLSKRKFDKEFSKPLKC